MVSRAGTVTAVRFMATQTRTGFLFAGLEACRYSAPMVRADCGWEFSGSDQGSPKWPGCGTAVFSFSAARPGVPAGFERFAWTIGSAFGREQAKTASYKSKMRKDPNRG